MDEEMVALKRNEDFTVTTLPPSKTVVGGRWVYAIKPGPEDSVRYKARWVAKGFSQKYGTDYDETFAST